MGLVKAVLRPPRQHPQKVRDLMGLGFDCIVRYFDGTGTQLYHCRKLLTNIAEVPALLEIGMADPRCVRVTLDMAV